MDASIHPPYLRFLLAVLLAGFPVLAAFAAGDGESAGPGDSPGDEAFEDRRLAMVERQIEARGIEDPEVLRAMRQVPRHLFVPDEEVSRAYNDHALPIGWGQTISQPFIVAYMTELLDLEPGDRILEVGTGSGYQAAVLADIIDEVYSIEIIAELAAAARERLDALGYGSVEVRRADGYWGWPEAAPFDGIIVTAAAGHVPPPLVDQLAPGGRLVIPMGHPYETQYITVIEKSKSGILSGRQLLPVRFVAFTGHIESAGP